MKYVPLFSPAPSKRRTSVETPSFSEEELYLYQTRYDEGYDLDIDPKYSLWKAMYHPDHSFTQMSPSPTVSFQSEMSPLPQLHLSDEDASSSDAAVYKEKEDVAILGRPTKLSKILSHSQPKTNMPTFQPKSSARVLTSLENIRILERKEREKREKQEMTDKRRKEREAKLFLKGNVTKHLKLSVIKIKLP